MSTLMIEIDAELSKEQILALRKGIVYNMNAMYDTLGINDVAEAKTSSTMLGQIERGIVANGSRFPFYVNPE